MKPLNELEAIAKACGEMETHFNANMETREWNQQRAHEVWTRNWNRTEAFREAFNRETVLKLIADLRGARDALEVVRDAAHSDGCGGLCWSDDAAYEAFEYAREFLSSLRLKGEGG
jgi:hypothetical protein